MNLLLSRLDEQQRRWYVALEAKKLGHGGVKQMSIVTGMDPDTIRRGTIELEDDLSTRPVESSKSDWWRSSKGGTKKARNRSQTLKIG